jgi:hypothetical protein
MQNWKNLTPHRPLDPGDFLYVPRPEGSGEALAARLRAGFGPLAVAGQMGCGKSTELAAAEVKLRAGRTTCTICRIQMDRLFDMRKEIPVEEVQRALASAVFEVAHPLGKQNLTASVKPRDLLLAALRHVVGPGPHEKPNLLIDGLEKCSEANARHVIRAILEFADDANLAIVVPTSMVLGPDAHDLLDAMEVFPVRAVLVDGGPQALAERGRAFFFDMALRRLGGPLGDIAELVNRAAVSSGGVPRAFLQLLRDAKRYAALAERDEPTLPDLEDAERDHAEHLERLLDQGDADALRAAADTTGRELDKSRRLRFLLHGLLLEYKADDRVFVRPAPLLARALAHRDAA